MAEVEEVLDIGRRRWEVQNPAHCVYDDIGVVLSKYSKGEALVFEGAIPQQCDFDAFAAGHECVWIRAWMCQCAGVPALEVSLSHRGRKLWSEVKVFETW